MSGNEEKHCVTGGDLALSGVFGPTGGAKPFLSQFAGNATLRTARDMKRSRMHIIYSGHVQGVGFRYAAKSVAPGFEVAGVVRNLPDGRVELIAEGKQDELESFRQAIRDSGMDHFIRDEQVSWTEAAGEFRGFEIVR